MPLVLNNINSTLTHLKNRIPNLSVNVELNKRENKNTFGKTVC